MKKLLNTLKNKTIARYGFENWRTIAVFRFAQILGC